MISFLLGIVVLYALVLGLIGLGAGRLSTLKIKQPSNTRSFSILIPFRDEAAYLPALLKSLNALDYPKNQHEILLIDDGSTDASAPIVMDFIARHRAQLNMVLHSLPKEQAGGKKQALMLGVERANHPWIATLDADTQVPARWLHFLDGQLEEQGVQMVCGPIAYLGGTSWLHGFQQLDNMALQTISRGLFGWRKPMLASGANLCYSQALFEQLGGFEGNLQHASGDDVFLLEKARKSHPKTIAFLNTPHATIKTYPLNSLQELIQQRIRWAGKARYQRSLGLRLLALLVGIANIVLLAVPFLLLAYPDSWEPLLAIVALKWSVDAWLIFQSAVLLETRPGLGHFMLSCLFYPIFGAWVFLQGLGKGYQWKQRRLQH